MSIHESVLTVITHLEDEILEHQRAIDTLRRVFRLNASDDTRLVTEAHALTQVLLDANKIATVPLFPPHIIPRPAPPVPADEPEPVADAQDPGAGVRARLVSEPTVGRHSRVAEEILRYFHQVHRTVTTSELRAHVRASRAGILFGMKALIARDLVRAIGERRATTYALIEFDKAPPIAVTLPVSAVAPPPPVETNSKHSERVFASPNTDPKSLNAKYAFFLMTHVFTTPGPQHIGDIVIKLSEKFGAADYDTVRSVLRDLEKEGACVEIRKGGELHFASTELGKPKSDIKDILLHHVFTTVGDKGLTVVIEEVKRHDPNLETHDIEKALRELVYAKSLSVRSVGFEQRYAPVVK